jgi:hypothetical protein
MMRRVIDPPVIAEEVSDVKNAVTALSADDSVSDERFV